MTVSPLSGSRDATAQTQISFLGVPARAIGDVSVVGSQSGAHSGRLLAYSQGDGASFVPSRPFAEGERVVARANMRSGGVQRRVLDVFAIADQDQITRTPETIHPGSASEVQGFQSRSDLHPPVVTVTAQSPLVAPGYEFVAPYTGPGQAGPMILDPGGGLVWFKPLPTDTFATNFRVQEYLGQAGADVVAGRHLGARLRARRRRDLRSVLRRRRPRACRQRRAGRSARFPAHRTGHRADHRV